jgi:hypothetical protein
MAALPCHVADRTTPADAPGPENVMELGRYPERVRCAALIVSCLFPIPSAGFAQNEPPPAPDNIVLQWNAALLQAVRNVRFAPMFTARAIAITHTCMYDAWAAYDRDAVGTRLGDTLRRPPGEWTRGNKEIATSFAAYRALVDLFPSEQPLFDALMGALGLDPLDTSVDTATPAGIGNVACAAVLELRRQDGSNQHGEINGGAPYSDYTGYAPVNDPEPAPLADPARWQPLLAMTGTPQVFLAPHWSRVTPFALTSPDQFRPKPPHEYPSIGYLLQAEAIRQMSASLTDEHKMIAEYWLDGPATETPPGHWSLLAQFVSRRDRHRLDDDVKMFFVLGNALLDASIAVWECKTFYDYVRPVSAVRHVYAGQMILAWAGPHQGTQLIPAEQFRSYIPTPPFAEYTSGHSAFSAASATVLRLFTDSPRFGAGVSFAAGTSVIEPGTTPSRRVDLFWETFDDAADEAGISRRYGGIHFLQADFESREMGKRIGRLAWRRALEYFHGRAN